MGSGLEVLSYVPRPPKFQGEGQGVSKLLNGELFAYANGSAVIIVDVQSLKQVNALVGGHVNATITALDWHPTCSSSSTVASQPLLCATGDSEGRVSIWDVTTGHRVAAMDDAYWAAFGSAALATDHSSRRTSSSVAESQRKQVKGLAWVTARNLLAILLSPGYLLLWDCRSGSIIWRRDLGPSDFFEYMQTDPSDRRRIVLSTAAGAFATLRFDSPSSDRIKYQRFQAEIAVGTLRCVLPGTKDMLVLLLQRELILFDLEYGHPAATTSLPSSMPSFDAVLFCCGHALAGIAPQDPGIDSIYCSHVDGSVSMWQREEEGSLLYAMISHQQLIGNAAGSTAQRTIENLFFGASGDSSAFDFGDANKENASTDDLQNSAHGSSAASPSTAATVTSTTTTTTMAMNRNKTTIIGAAQSSMKFQALVAGSWRRFQNSSRHDQQQQHQSSTNERCADESITTSIELNMGGDMPHLHTSSVPSGPLAGTFHHPHPGRVRQLSSLSKKGSGDMSSTEPVAEYSIVVMGIGQDGSVWQWKLPLLQHQPHTGASLSSSTITTTTEKSKGPFSNEITLLGTLHSLSQQVTAMSALPYLISIDTRMHASPSPFSSPPAAADALSAREVVSVVAVGTLGGCLELLSIQQGRILPLHMEVSSSISVHSGAVKGIQWLGKTSRVVSYSSERLRSSSGVESYVNTLQLTDFCSGGSFQFRTQSSSDPAPLIGIKASETGSYILLIFKGLPSEVWYLPTSTRTTTGAYTHDSINTPTSSSDVSGRTPVRLRQVDLHFTSVEWMASSTTNTTTTTTTTTTTSNNDNNDNNTTPDTDDIIHWASHSSAANGIEQFIPEECLVFTLADGRIGVLSIQGRKIKDTKPHMPTWMPLATGEFSCSCAASYGNYVFLGGVDGSLVMWNVTNGQTLVVESGCSRLHKLFITPIATDTPSSPPSPSSLHTANTNTNKNTDVHGEGRENIVARIAMLSSSGAFTVWSLTSSGQLVPTSVTWTSSIGKIGRAVDIDWVNIPKPYGAGSVVVAVLEGGAVALVHTMPLTSSKNTTAAAAASNTIVLKMKNDGVCCLSMANTPRALSALLLPQRHILRLLLQQGAPATALRSSCSLFIDSSSSTSSSMLELFEEIETELLSRLPVKYRNQFTPASNTNALSNNTSSDLSSPPPPVPASNQDELIDMLELLRLERQSANYYSGSPSADASHLSNGAASLPPRPGAPLAPLSPVPPAAAMTSNLDDQDIAAKLGLRRNQPPNQRQNIPLLGATNLDVAQTIKTLGESVKDIASASKDQLSKKLSRNNSGSLPSTMLSSLGDGSLHHISASGGGGGINNGTTSGNSIGGGSSSSSIGGGRSLLDNNNNNNRSGSSSNRHTLIASSQPTTTTTIRHASIIGILQSCALIRGLPCPLSDSEMEEYESALSMHSVAHRMALAARICSGCAEEYQFWKRLPQTLIHMKNSSMSGIETPIPSTSKSDHFSLLWSPMLEKSIASERSQWHSKMKRQIFESSETLQEMKVLEYVSLGDLQGAVGFLLASAPGQSTRFYRDALCTLGMAFACGLRSKSAPSSSSAAATTASGIMDEAARSLFVQSAKVITANAAAVGDSLIGVPLLCSTGEFDNAVSILQDAGLWSYAAALAAACLSPSARVTPMERWVNHVAEAEGRLWAAAGLLIGCGLVSSAIELFLQSGLPDAAAGVLEAARECGVEIEIEMSL